MSEIKFLIYLIIFPNVLGSLLLHVLRHDVLVSGYLVSDVPPGLLPRKENSTVSYNAS